MCRCMYVYVYKIITKPCNNSLCVFIKVIQVNKVPVLDAFENLTTVIALRCQGTFVSSNLLVWDLFYAADALVADETAILPESPGAFT